MKRSEVWWADFEPARGGEIRKHRPAVILSAGPLAARRRTIVVAPISSGPTPRWPLIVDLPSVGHRSVAVCDQIRALGRSRFDRRFGALDEADMERLGAALARVLDL